MKALQIKSFKDYQKEYEKSLENPESFWNQIAENFLWHQPWHTTLDYNFKEAHFRWFEGGKLNITENCLDRHIGHLADKKALIWEPNDPNEASRSLTYSELLNEVCKFSNVLQSHGLQKGDRICLYMPMIPELTIAMLACARIGAVHSIVFAGFSSTAIANRINDAECRMLITANEGFRGSKCIPLKNICDQALENCPSIEKVIVYRRTEAVIPIMPGRDVIWQDEITLASKSFPAVSMDAEDTLFILYTSGSTGTPKGMVHSCGGYMIYTAYSFINVFQYTPGLAANKDTNIYWCTADIGWITGHSYIVYGPLLAGATTVMFEGSPTYPDAGRLWEVCDRHQVTHFYTAPTAIRALAKQPRDFVNRHQLKSLKVLGSVGEPINEEAWNWYNEHIGKGNCPIVDTWWQTETGGMMIAPLAGITPAPPTFATLPLPGIQPVLIDEQGDEIPMNQPEIVGRLAIRYPWPSMARTIYGNHKRYQQIYYSEIEDHYFTGDGAFRDAQGNYRITGRVDDVIIVSGHNLGTAPIENAINEHPAVVESAIVGFPHAIKGTALCAFVILHNEQHPDTVLESGIRNLVSKTIGPIAKPEIIQFVPGLPKTRSGKIMRRILRKIAADQFDHLGDTATLLNPEIVEQIISTRMSMRKN